MYTRRLLDYLVQHMLQAWGQTDTRLILDDQLREQGREYSMPKSEKFSKWKTEQECSNTDANFVEVHYHFIIVT